MSTTTSPDFTLKLAQEFNRYFTSSNSVDVSLRITVNRDEWRQLYQSLRQSLAKPPSVPKQGQKALEAVEEQACLNGVGAERELALRAQLAEATRELESLKAWKARVVKAAEEVHGPDALRFKLSLKKNGTATNEFPQHLDQRWVSFVYAEDDAHVGTISQRVDALIEKAAATAAKDLSGLR